MRTITTLVSEMYVDDKGIVHLSFPMKNVKVSSQDALDILNSRLELKNAGSEQLILTDLRNGPNPSIGARNVAKSASMSKSTKALALLVGGPVSRVLGNFFIGFNRGDYPVKLFTHKEEAIEWLLKFK